MKLSRDGQYPAFTLLAHQSDNYRIALKAGVMPRQAPTTLCGKARSQAGPRRIGQRQP